MIGIDAKDRTASRGAEAQFVDTSDTRTPGAVALIDGGSAARGVMSATAAGTDYIDIAANRERRQRVCACLPACLPARTHNGESDLMSNVCKARIASLARR